MLVHFVSGFALLCTVGCTDSKPCNNRANAAILFDERPTDDDCRRFAKSLEKAAQSSDVAAINQAIDWDRVIHHATTPSEGTKEFNNIFILTTKRDLRGKGGIGANIARLTTEGGEFRYLRTHTKEGKIFILFRLLIPKKPALDYFDFEVAKLNDGTVAAIDYFVYRNGETISHSIRRRYQSIASAASKALARSELTQQEMDVAENSQKVSEMTACSDTGDGRRALEIYAQLPIAFQNEKNALLARLAAAHLVGAKEYDDALQAIRSAIPDDPCLDFILYDYYLSHHQYENLRAAIDRLDSQLGGDSCLDARRALSYVQEKNYKLARKYAQKAIDAEDTLSLPHYVLLQSSLEEKNFDETRRLLIVMQEKSLMTIPDLTALPAYAEFVKSSQYQTLLKKVKPQ